MTRNHKKYHWKLFFCQKELDTIEPERGQTPINSDVRLNYDVLHNVMEFLAPDSHRWGVSADIFPIMRTCRTLHALGIPLFLGQEITLFTNPRAVSSFCDFLLSNPSYPQYLRGFLLEGPVRFPYLTPMPVQLELTGRLVRVLNAAANLRSLRLFQLERVLSSNELFSASLSSLTNLNNLWLSDVGPRSVSMLRDLRSPLRGIRLLRDPWSWSPPAAGPEAFSSLAHFSEHLREIDFFLSRPGLGDRTILPSVQFLGLHTLRVFDATEIYLPTLIRLFPNLRRLTLRLARTSRNLLQAELLRSRQDNRLGLQKGWTHLDELHCDVPTTFALGLQCTVQFWDAFAVYPADNQLFHSLLGELRPSHLHLPIYTQDVATSPSDFQAVLPPQSSTVTHLVLDVHLSDTLLREADVMDKLVSWVSGLEIHFLVVNVCFSGYHVPDPTPQDAQARQMRIRQIVEAASHLQYISVTVRHRLGHQIHWEVQRDGSDVRIKALSSTDFDQIKPRCFL